MNKPQLRFNAFEDDWEEKKLGDSIIEVNERTSDFNKNPLFSLTIENGITAKTERYERSQLVTKEDDLFKIMHPQNFATNPMNLRFGAVGFCKENSDVSVSGYYDVFSIDDNKCSSFWYPYFKTFNSLKKFDDAATGSLIEKRRVHFSTLKQMGFSQPSLEEKKKIGSFLSSIDTLIQAKTKKLESLKTVKKSLLQKCFPKDGEKVPLMRFEGFSGEWEEKVFHDGVFTDFIVPMRDKPKKFGGTIPWTRIEDIEGKYINGTTSNQYVSEETVKSMNLKIIPKNSLIVSSSASFGIVAIVTNDLITNQTFIGLVPSTKYDLDFLYVLFQSEDVLNKMKLKSAGSTIFYIAREEFENLSTLFPSSIEEQQKIGQFFSKYDEMISLKTKEIEKLKVMKKALLQKMFV